MTALPNKCYSGHHKATKKEDDQETRGKKIWRGRCGQRASGLDGGRWRRQHKIELDGDEWSVAYAPLGATRHKSSKSNLTYKTAIMYFSCEFYTSASSSLIVTRFACSNSDSH